MIQHPALPFVRVNADITEVVLALMWKELTCNQSLTSIGICASLQCF